MVETIIIDCKNCKSGMIGYGEDRAICPDCEGKGYHHLDAEVYYRKLRRNLKNEREQNK